jgi:hypothetical protein
MKTANIASATLRHSESGLLWEEKLTNSTGTLELTQYATFRVRAAGATTVTIDGVLAMTMMANEIAVFCVGRGSQDDTKTTVTVIIGGANAYVQVARDKDREKLN